jgi:hypothetical protein
MVVVTHTHTHAHMSTHTHPHTHTYILTHIVVPIAGHGEVKSGCVTPYCLHGGWAVSSLPYPPRIQIRRCPQPRPHLGGQRAPPTAFAPSPCPSEPRSPGTRPCKDTFRLMETEGNQKPRKSFGKDLDAGFSAFNLYRTYYPRTGSSRPPPRYPSFEQVRQYHSSALYFPLHSYFVPCSLYFPTLLYLLYPILLNSTPLWSTLLDLILL